MFELLGHDNPLGRYPSPVVPVGKLNGQLVAVFAGTDGNETQELGGDEEYTHHTDSVAKKLQDFDYERDRLFAFNEEELVFYEVAREREWFSHVLQDSRLSDDNPFLRLALAKIVSSPNLLLDELYRCVASLTRTKAADEFIDDWYAKEKESVLRKMDPQHHFRVPATWKRLLRIRESSRPIVSRPEPTFFSQSGSQQWGGSSAGAAMGTALVVVTTFNNRANAERAYRLLHDRKYDARDVSLLLLEQTFKVAFPELQDEAHISELDIAPDSLVKLLIAAESAKVGDTKIVCAGPYAKNFGGITVDGIPGNLITGLTSSGLSDAQAQVCDERLKHGSILMGVNSVREDDAWYFENQWIVE